ncbi:MAG: class I SAM-dependent methyltransferase [Planctomycetota bacterium]|nr:class I SAM-dependent methyltransferase [Planctomycetota bacterium]
MPAQTHRLYADLAPLWPAFSPPAHEAREAKIVLRALRARLGPWRSSGKSANKPALLDLGCGGGHLLHHLGRHCHAVGVDLAPAMLALSARLNPDVEHHQGDMRTIRLRRRFDAVLLHDAVNYMLTPADLLAALRTAAIHLRPGCALVAMPDDVAETFTNHAWAHDAASTPTHDLAMVTHVATDRASASRGSAVDLAMLFLLHDRERGQLDVVDDRHRLGLFPRATWERLLRRAGFGEIEFAASSPGRPAPMFVATKARHC